MEFTESYKQSGPCCFSPNSRFIAVAVDSRLVVRDTLSFKVLIYSRDVRCRFKFQDVKCVSWSPCEQFLAVGIYDPDVESFKSSDMEEYFC